MTAPNNQHHTLAAAHVRHHPLFKGVDDAAFEQLYSRCQLLSFETHEIILHSKTERESLLLILNGTVEVFVQGAAVGKEEVLEILQTGDLIGLSSIADFLGEPVHIQTQHNVGVRSIEPTQCLDIPFDVLEQCWEDEEIRNYMLRQLAVRLKDVYASLAEQVYLAQRWGESEPFVRRVHDLMSSPVICAQSSDTIQHVARKMIDNNVSSVVVLEETRLAGIITESDLVRQMGTEIGNTQTQPSARSWMTPNPVTVNSDDYYYEALALFLTENIKHLPVIKDGQVVGMLTLSDLMRKKNRGLFDSIQTIEKADIAHLGRIKEAIYSVFANLLRDDLPVTHILEVLTTLYDRLVQHCLQLASETLKQKGLGGPPVPYCWLHMGSSGRAEQFMLTDQDHFLVYASVDHLDENDRHQAANYFSHLAETVVDYLQRAGFAKCKGNMMATNPDWRGPLSYWQQTLRQWALRATNNTLMQAHNFLAFRMVQGDQHLYEQFLQLIKEELKPSSIFLYRMAVLEKEHSVPTLDHPLRSLLRLGKKEIDLKKEALFPFHHALQILALHHGLYEGTPLDKMEHLVGKKVFTPSFKEELLYAYTGVMKIRMEHAWHQFNQKQPVSSRLPVSQLNYREKEDLRRALKTIRSLQQQMFIHFGM
ncbi:DUF294 nucleotidyltransferase-like domain-containing protein [Caldalkalibacillus uzonensis]|nr:DUF294 nucleotidyltransferase-like domain-containing protein [Caldalkalibacillus uzonensis]